MLHNLVISVLIAKVDGGSGGVFPLDKSGNFLILAYFKSRLYIAIGLSTGMTEDFGVQTHRDDVEHPRYTR